MKTLVLAAILALSAMTGAAVMARPAALGDMGFP